MLAVADRSIEPPIKVSLRTADPMQGPPLERRQVLAPSLLTAYATCATPFALTETPAVTQATLAVVDVHLGDRHPLCVGPRAAPPPLARRPGRSKFSGLGRDLLRRRFPARQAVNMRLHHAFSSSIQPNASQR
ncbi:MAG: hypothetical protein C0485_09925 [Pirellula sp.]|nr:hypothetical protein [Pirellula sp.]